MGSLELLSYFWSLNTVRLVKIANFDFGGLRYAPTSVVRRGNSENTQYTSIGIHSNLSTTSVWWRNGHLKDALEQPCRSWEICTGSQKQECRSPIHPPTARSPSSSSKPLSQSPSISTPRCLSRCGSHKFLCKYSWFPRHNILGSAGGGQCWCLPLLPCNHLVLRKDALHFSGNFVAFFGGSF